MDKSDKKKTVVSTKESIKNTLASLKAIREGLSVPDKPIDAGPPF